LIHNEIVTTSNVTAFVRKVNSTNGEKPFAIAIAHKDTIERLESETASRFTDAGWNGDELTVATSVKRSEVELVNVFCLFQRQLEFLDRPKATSGYSLRRMGDPLNSDETIEAIEALDRQVYGGRERSGAVMRSMLKRHNVFIATKAKEHAGFLLATVHDSQLPMGIALIDLHEPVVSENHPIELGPELIKFVVDNIHCFASITSLVVMTQRSIDVGVNTELAKIGFEPSYPIERDESSSLIWTYNSANDFSARISLAGSTKEETKENIIDLFTTNPNLAITDAISRYRMPGFDRERVIALKAVASRDTSAKSVTKKSNLPKQTLETDEEIRIVFRNNPDMTVEELLVSYDVPARFTEKDGRETPFILAGMKAGITKELMGTKKTKPKEKKIREINNADEVREFMIENPDMTVPEMMDDLGLSIAPSLTHNEKGKFTTQKLAGIRAGLTVKGLL
jgi:hypothetical protein